MCWSWLSGCFAGFTKQPKLSQDEFEKLIDYLGAVPIFRKQLPKSELPKVAKSCKQLTWNPGDRVIRQGDDGKAFFIIKSGEATVIVEDKEGNIEERVTLYRFDYFGGHSLTSNRPNVATIMAKGPNPLVTLSMTRADFEALGLHRTLKFPRRPAIYEGVRTDNMRAETEDAFVRTMSDQTGEAPTGAELEFLFKAVRANPNFKKALGSVPDEKVQQLVRAARKRRVKTDEDLAQSGDLLQEFYIVANGSFDVMSGSANELMSVEAKVTHMTKAQKRLLLKERFVASLQAANLVGPSKEKISAAEIRKKGGGRGGVRATSVKVERNFADSPSSGDMRRGPRARSLIGWQSMTANKFNTPFQNGDVVARVVVGSELAQEVGTVVEVLKFGYDGTALVEFKDPTRQEKVMVSQLRPARDMAPIATLKSGMCYGDLCLLYNTRLTTTCRARETSMVYAVSRWEFKKVFSRESPLLQEHYMLLDDVHVLNGLVRSERWEIARSAAGVFKFKAGERVLQQGDAQPDPMLYIIKEGNCIVTKETVSASGQRTVQELATLRRASCFGEREILRGEKTTECSVDAGPEGLTCLCIEGQILLRFLTSIDSEAGDHPGIMLDVDKYLQSLPNRSNKELDIPLASLEIVSLLGEGGFGSVFLAESAGKQYALKRLSKGFVVQAQATRQVALERDILTMVDSDFIIKLYRTYKDKEYVYMLLELCDGGHLFQVLADARAEGNAILPSAVMFYIASVTFAIGHLHERHIAYRDLKAENVLLDGRGYVKLCDMGFTKFVVDKSHTLLGTPEYMAPEMIDPPHAHDGMVDWWALGVLTFELLTGQDPWYDCGVDGGDDPMGQLLAIRDSHDEGVPERLIPRSQSLAKDFIKRLLCINVKRRLGFRDDGKEVRQDPWFSSKNFDFNALYEQRLPSPERPGGHRTKSVPAELRPKEGSLGMSAFETDEALFAPAPEDMGEDSWADGF